MISVLAALFSLLGWSYYLNRKFPLLGFHSVVATIALIILILFAASGLGFLMQTAWVLLIGGNALLAKSLHDYLKNINTVSLSGVWFLFFAAGCVLIYFSREAHLWNWDEFFWVLFPRSMQLENAWYTAFSPILTPKYAYPPAASLWQYFFILFGEFRERALFMAMGIWNLALVFAVAVQFKAKLAKVLAGALLVYVWWILVIDPSGLLTLYIDHTIAFMFSWGLSLIFEFFDKKLPYRWLFILPAMLLPIIKPSGIVMSGMLLGFYSIKLWRDVPNKTLSVQMKIARLVLATTLLGLPMGLWQYHVKSGFQGDIPSVSEQSMVDSVLGMIGPRRQKIWQAQIETLLSGDHELRLFSLISLIWFMALFFIVRKKFKRGVLILGVITAGLYVWMRLMLTIYAYLTAPGNVYTLPSFWRYLSSFFAGYFVAGVYLLSKLSGRYQVILLVTALIFLNLIFSEYKPLRINLFLPTSDHIKTWETTREVFANVVYLGNRLPRQSKIWLTAPGSDGLEPMYIRQALFPRTFNWWCWQLTTPEGIDDPWSCPLSDRQWSQILIQEGYTHALILKVDDEFLHRYKTLFGQDTSIKPGWYTINVVSGEEIKLTPTALMR